MRSIAQLYDAHLVKKEKEIREQLKNYGSGAAPAELVRKADGNCLREIQAQGSEALKMRDKPYHL